MTIFFFKLYKFETLNIPGFKNEENIKIKSRLAITIENKLYVFKNIKKICAKVFYNGAV